MQLIDSIGKAKMTTVVKQLWVALAALICVLSFWAAAVVRVGDAAAITILALVPAACGGLLAFVSSAHALTLPLYSAALMLALAHLRIYPYYSPDLSPSGPTLFYSMVSVPAAFAGTSIVLLARVVRKKRRRPISEGSAAPQRAAGPRLNKPVSSED